MYIRQYHCAVELHDSITSKTNLMLWKFLNEIPCLF